MKKTVLICTLLKIIFLFPVLVYAQAGTANGTYDFSLLNRDNSGGAGFKKQLDKFKVSNIFNQDGTAIYANNSTSGMEQRVIIKAEGGTVNKHFTFRNLNLRNYMVSSGLDVFTLTLRNYNGTQIAQHVLASEQFMTTAPVELSTFNFSVPFPADGYPGVAEIQIDFHYTDATVSPDELTFNTITVSDISSSVLALTLHDFTLKKENKGTRIKWTTANEQNVYKIVLEHSRDGIQFSPIAAFPVKAGTSAYSFFDRSPANGRNFYRLKEIDKYGVEKIYVVKFIDFSEGGLLITGANPVIGPLFISGLSEGMHNVSLTDMIGRVLQSIRISSQADGNYTFATPTSLPAGTYVLTVDSGFKRVSTKLVKR